MFLPTLLLTLGLMVLAVAGLGMRLLLIKGGQFRGSCANNNPMLEKQIGKCTVCGRDSGEACGKDDVK
jgi:hypothetical protein